MLTEWSAECGADDPVIEVPWTSPDGALRWTDLRTDPHAVDEITEADEYPALLAALRALNASRSPVYTSKCDVWEMDADELAHLRADLLLEEDVATAGITSYIDIVVADRTTFASRHQAEQLMHRIDRMAGELPHSLAKLELVLRPAVVDFDAVQEGYAITLYVKGCGVDIFEANERWSAALRDVARLIRGMQPRS
ncbi:MAG: hypothetical protein JSS87_05015 [Acidobacteria bacterium]|nr:hypothetical protein [Acidobacteriota bacterium]